MGALGLVFFSFLIPVLAWLVIGGAMLIWRQLVKSAYASVRYEALVDAANIAKERADFEMADTEGSSGQRLNRASIAYELQREFLSMAGRRC